MFGARYFEGVYVSKCMMLWWVVLAGLALFLLYAIRVLFFNLEEDPNTSLDDFIKDAPGKKINC